MRPLAGLAFGHAEHQQLLFRHGQKSSIELCMLQQAHEPLVINPASIVSLNTQRGCPVSARQPTVTEELVLRGRFQTLPIAIYGWALSTHAQPDVSS